MLCTDNIYTVFGKINMLDVIGEFEQVVVEENNYWCEKNAFDISNE